MREVLWEGEACVKAGTDAAIDVLGKNKQVKRVFLTLFVAMAGLVLARVPDPVTVQQIFSLITSAVP